MQFINILCKQLWDMQFYATTGMMHNLKNQSIIFIVQGYRERNLARAWFWEHWQYT